MDDYKTYKCMARWADKTKDTDILDFLGKQAAEEIRNGTKKAK